MSLENWSHISQIIGAVAVVISLLYVGFQVQQNNQALWRQENDVTMAQWQIIRQGVIADREVAQLWVTGLKGERLSEADAVRFEMLMSEFTWATFHIWDRSQRGSLDRAEFERGAAQPLVRLFCTPGGAAWWRDGKEGYAEGFGRDVDRVLAQARAANPQRCVVAA